MTMLVGNIPPFKTVPAVGIETVGMTMRFGAFSAL